MLLTKKSALPSEHSTTEKSSAGHSTAQHSGSWYSTARHGTAPNSAAKNHTLLPSQMLPHHAVISFHLAVVTKDYELMMIAWGGSVIFAVVGVVSLLVVAALLSFCRHVFEPGGLG